MRVALSRKPKSHGPGLVYMLVALVVVALAGARFFGFMPGRNGESGGSGQEQRRQEQPQAPGGPGAQPRREQMTQVLIYHTHTTENYAPKPTHESESGGDVAAVGRALVEELKKLDIAAVHMLTVHDLPQWSSAAHNARTSLEEALNRNNGIRVVVDIHRDAIPGERQEGYATANIGGEDVARLLLIVGTSGNSRVDANMRFAERLKERLDALAPGITRGVRVLPQQTNGDLHENHVTIYVGDYHDSTLEQAQASMRWLAAAIAELLREDG